MYSSGKYSTKEIELIKDSLKYEGWEENETIPNGWRIKRDKNSSIFLLEQGGKRFLSSTKAYTFVKKYRKYYSEEDLEKLRIMMYGSNSSSSRMVKVSRNKNESSDDSSWLTDASLYPEEDLRKNRKLQTQQLSTDNLDRGNRHRSVGSSIKKRSKKLIIPDSS